MVALSQAREHDWAKNFVEKVVHQRQTQFEGAWQAFPEALSKFTGKPVLVCSLADTATEEAISSINRAHNSKAATAAAGVGARSGQGTMGAAGGSTAGSRTSGSATKPLVSIATIRSPMKASARLGGSSTAQARSTGKEGGSKGSSTGKGIGKAGESGGVLITADDVAAAIGRGSVMGGRSAADFRASVSTSSPSHAPVLVPLGTAVDMGTDFDVSALSSGAAHGNTGGNAIGTMTGLAKVDASYSSYTASATGGAAGAKTTDPLATLRMSQSLVEERARPPVQEEVASVFPHPSESYHFLPGPLARHALSSTVQVEVAKELNALVNGEFRSRRLAQDIRSVYGPLSDPTPQNVLNKNKSMAGAAGALSKSTKLAPVKLTGKLQRQHQKSKVAGKGGKVVSPPPKRKKMKIGPNGLPIPDMGKIESTHTDWLGFNSQSNAPTQGVNDAPEEYNVYGKAAEPGQALLLDIPQGINDTIERLLHAAALRCYVPDFFQGVTKSDSNAADLDLDLESVDDSVDELEVAERLRQRRQKIKAGDGNPNSDADYAYNMYQQMPMGLAKIRYELLCKKWGQGTTYGEVVWTLYFKGY